MNCNYTRKILHLWFYAYQLVLTPRKGQHHTWFISNHFGICWHYVLNCEKELCLPEAPKTCSRKITSFYRRAWTCACVPAYEQAKEKWNWATSIPSVEECDTLRSSMDVWYTDTKFGTVRSCWCCCISEKRESGMLARNVISLWQSQDSGSLGEGEKAETNREK